MLSDILVELNGTLTFHDLLRFQYSRCYKHTWWIVLVMMLVSLAGVFLVATVAFLTSELELALHNGTPFLLLLGFWTLMVMAPYWGAKRLMKTTIPLSAPITFIFSSRGLCRTGLHFSSEISYEALWAVRETKSMFLLYLGAGSAILLPKRFFKDPIHQNDWRILVAHGISPKCITGSGFRGRWL